MQNKDKLEKIVQQQRLQMFFQSRIWLEERAENCRLREAVLVLQTRLLDAGLSADLPEQSPETDDSQLSLALFESQAAG
jgi:hypothetical protein